MTSLSETSLLAGASGATSGYTIDQSIRFARTDNTTGGSCMHRTPSGAGNRKKWTFSFWFKLGAMNNFAQGSGHYYGIFSVDAATNDANRAILSIAAPSGGSDEFRIQFQGHGTIFMLTTREFKDPSAWYHLVLVWDTFDGVPVDRQKLFINGVRETAFQTFNAPSSEQEIGMNLASRTLIGASRNISTSQDIYRWDGYMADIHFLDGYAYGPEYFGEFKSDTDIWIPKEYEGSYGSNGYKIDGRDASDLGDDESGNGNDFTTINHGTDDQVIDTPTNNFCVINSAYADNAGAGNAGTLSEGNLKYVGGGSTFSVRGFTFNLPKSGKWYFEYTIGGTEDGFGYIIQGEQGSINASNGPGNVSAAQGGGIQYRGWRNGGNYTTTFADYASSSFSAGDIHQIAIDVDNQDFYYGIANVYQAADAGKDGNPSSGSNPLVADFAFLTNDVVLLAGNYSGTQHWNFGQNGTFNGTKTAQGNSDGNGIGNFYYAVPTGFLALCSSNLGKV